MSRLASLGRNTAENRAKERRFAPACAAAGALALTLTATAALAPAALAQSNSGIVINSDVLNSLGPGPAATAPLAPQPGYLPAPQVRAQPSQAPVLRLPPQQAPGSQNFQSYGNGNYVVTRPGTLLFPPLEAPASTLAPDFQDNHAARAEAMQNAFAEGPEPSSQLLIPLDNGQRPAGGASADGSIVVFMDNLPPVDESAAAGDAPRLTLRRPPIAVPQPAPRKPEVSPEMLAEVGVTTVDEPAAPLAPEFQTPAKNDAAPTMAEVPPVAEVETAAIEPAPAAPAPVVQTPVVQATAETATTATAAPGNMAAPAAQPAEVPQSTAKAGAMPASSADMPAPVATTEPAPREHMAQAESDGPVNLLPASEVQAAAPMTGETVASADVPAPIAAAPATPGVQTASLAVGAPLEDISVTFDNDSAELSDLVQAELLSLADSLRANEAGRIQVLGFASAKDGSQDLARKLALSRALKVRSFLIDAGVPSARIQIRPAGEQTGNGPANRVDIRPIDS
ncbi:OmpA family protein [Pelagibius sp. CAU 1746]|uniref:OmpA family protein n=1 Tax=Pelagibius sp. CAU 1746 TaxID=3140370 RepID=UPI00325A816F